MRRNAIAWTVLASACALQACQELSPTTVDERLLPEEPVTFEVRLPWNEFASNLEVFGGYGSPVELGSGVVARDFAGELNAVTLVRIGQYPRQTTVPDSTGSTRTDSILTFTTGRVVVALDTLASTNEGPVTLALGRTTRSWDARTATWTFAVDTINDRQEWDEPGALPADLLGTAVWDPAAGDTVVFPVDSAQVAAWSDTTAAEKGVRLELRTPGERLKVRSIALRLDTRPSINPDTVVVLTAAGNDLTFLYDPVPAPPPDGIRIGGAPSWRTVLDVAVPRTVTPEDGVCARIACPVAIDADRLNYAALVLHTRRTETAFQPTDTVNLDVRPVLLRSALPKAPLGSSLTGALGRRVRPELFGDEEGAAIEVPVTAFVRNLLRGADEAGSTPTNTLALLSTFEPLSISFASFHGPGSELEPVLRLIVTAGPAVELP